MIYYTLYFIGYIYIRYYILYLTYYVSYIIYHILYIIYHILYIIYYISYIIYYILYIIYHIYYISYIIYYILYIIYHISYIVYYILYIHIVPEDSHESSTLELPQWEWPTPGVHIAPLPATWRLSRLGLLSWWFHADLMEVYWVSTIVQYWG